MPAFDFGALSKPVSLQDYQQMFEQQQLQKQLAGAQLLEARAKIAQAGNVDIDKLGEQAFLKASQGMPLSPQEGAALNYIDAKSPTVTFNPATGAREERPSLLQRAGVNNPMQQQQTSQPAARPVQLSGGDAPTQQVTQQPSEWDAAFQNELQAANGNPKLQQSIRENYAKAKISMNDEQSKAAGFSDRMQQASPIITSTQKAATDPMESTKDSVPLIGNFLVSNDKQSANQAQKDFLNAILRRESGAAISASEFSNGKQQYFPVPGDSDQVIQQKADNRQSAINAVSRSAGPAYKPVSTPKLSAQEIDESLFNARQAIKANPAKREGVIQKLRAAGIEPKGL